MTFEEYVWKVTENFHHSHFDWRHGQTAFNILRQVRPDLSEQVRASVIDPFYNDRCLPNFYEWVEENW